MCWAAPATTFVFVHSHAQVSNLPSEPLRVPCLKLARQSHSDVMCERLPLSLILPRFSPSRLRPPRPWLSRIPSRCLQTSPCPPPRVEMRFSTTIPTQHFPAPPMHFCARYHLLQKQRASKSQHFVLKSFENGLTLYQRLWSFPPFLSSSGSNTTDSTQHQSWS